MKCLTEEVLQSYVDDELSAETRRAATAHINNCATCSRAVQGMESEAALISAALEHALSIHVPTERMRARLNDAIAAQSFAAPVAESVTDDGKRPANWLEFFANLFAASPRRVAVFASLAAALIFWSIFLLIPQTQHTAPQLAKRQSGFDSVISTANNQTRQAHDENTEIHAAASTIDDKHGVNQTFKSVAVATTKNRQVHRENYARARETSIVAATRRSPALDEKDLPGERTYLNAIASLSAVIESSGENVLPEAARREYRRNLVVVDQAIAATRREARRNPHDGDATEFLLAAYQSKLDLLDTIATAAR
jgi:hypothetical protein